MTASSKTDEQILVVGEVTKRFGGLRAVDRASFTVARGSITALIPVLATRTSGTLVSTARIAAIASS